MSPFLEKLELPVRRVIIFQDHEGQGEITVTPWPSDEGVDIAVHVGPVSYFMSVSHDAAQALSQAAKNTRTIMSPIT